MGLRRHSHCSTLINIWKHISVLETAVPQNWNDFFHFFFLMLRMSRTSVAAVSWLNAFCTHVFKWLCAPLCHRVFPKHLPAAWTEQEAGWVPLWEYLMLYMFHIDCTLPSCFSNHLLGKSNPHPPLSPPLFSHVSVPTLNLFYCPELILNIEDKCYHPAADVSWRRGSLKPPYWLQQH